MPGEGNDIITKIIDWIKALFKAIWKFLKELFKALLPIILLVAALYFLGPMLGTWLQGIPGMGWLGNFLVGFPGMVQGFLGSIWGWVQSGWTWFTQLEFGTKALVLLGAGLVLAPEETTELLVAVAEGAVGLVGSVIGSLLTSSPVAVLLIGVAAFWLIRRTKRESAGETSNRYFVKSDEDREADKLERRELAAERKMIRQERAAERRAAAGLPSRGAPA